MMIRAVDIPMQLNDYCYKFNGCEEKKKKRLQGKDFVPILLNKEKETEGLKSVLIRYLGNKDGNLILVHMPLNSGR